MFVAWECATPDILHLQLVSTDLVHWSRKPSVLSPNGDWDGALTILNGQPVIMFDCFNVPDCRPPPLNSSASRSPILIQNQQQLRAEKEDRLRKRVESGDPPIVGVARPVDPSDPNLTKWRKDDANPIVVGGAHGAYAGPSTIWQSPNGAYNMLMGGGSRGGTARYESTDPTLHNWTAADLQFYPVS